MNMQSHLKIKKKNISDRVLLPGDPSRVDLIGKFLSKFKIIANNREFRIGVGYYKDKKITVCSTGIGCPSTAIAVEELINIGVKYLIRVGTCGGAWKKDIPWGSVIIPTACVRDEGVTAEYIPSGFPAVADIDVVLSLQDSAIKNKQKYFVGINRTHDAFYGSMQSVTKWGKYLLEKRWGNCDTPILSSDMETAALFVISSLRGVKAGAVLAVNSRPEPLLDRLFGKKQRVVIKEKNDRSLINNTIKLALDAIVIL